jgi:hypothetical protein
LVTGRASRRTPPRKMMTRTSGLLPRLSVAGRRRMPDRRGERGDAKRRTRSGPSSSGRWRSRGSPEIASAASYRDRDVDLVPHRTSRVVERAPGDGCGTDAETLAHRYPNGGGLSSGGLFRASLTRDLFGLENGGEPPGKARNQTRPKRCFPSFSLFCFFSCLPV